MASLRDFRIPIKGLPEGSSLWEYEMLPDFFTLLEDVQSVDGTFHVTVDAFKKPGIIQLDISVSGHKKASCDICLTEIHVPAQGEYTLYCKYIGDHMDEQEEDVIIIDQEQSHLSLAMYFYEYILLSLPITNRIDCEEMPDRPCDDEVLDKMEDPIIDDQQEENENPWDTLRDIQIDS